MRIREYRLHWTSLLIAGWLASGCLSYRTESQEMMAAYGQGDLERASLFLDTSKTTQSTSDSRDKLLWLLERGKILHDLGRFAESNTALIEADTLMRRYDLAPSLSVSGEAAAMMLDQTVRPYDGTGADRILVCTFIALNDLALGDVQEAQVYGRRAHDRQAEVLNNNAGALSGTKALPVLPDAETQGWATPAYARYANPLASYVSALLAELDGDPAEARLHYERVQAMVPHNHFVVDALRTPTPPARTVVVLFETGLAPRLVEHKQSADGPGGPYTEASLPGLAFATPDVTSLGVAGGGQDCRTEELASVNSIVAADFKSRLPLIMQRTAVSGLKGVFTLTTNTNGQRRTVSTTNSDLRTWRTLPADIQLARIARPSGGSLTLTPAGIDGGSGDAVTVAVPDAPLTMIFARSVDRHRLRYSVAAVPAVPAPAQEGPK